jgi:hypothetical protein
VIDHIVSTGVSNALQTVEAVPLLPVWLQPGRLLAHAGVTVHNYQRCCAEVSGAVYVLAQALCVLAHQSSVGELLGGLRRVAVSTTTDGSKGPRVQLGTLSRHQVYLMMLGTVS